MGLDMYLTRRHYVQRWDHIPHDKQFAVSVTRGGNTYNGIDPKRVIYVVEQVAYWRKANAIHKWFVDTVQQGEDDCGDYYVPREKLSELLDLVTAIIAGKAKGEDVLPTQAGFFFGGTEYDDGYLIDMVNTRDQIAAALADEVNDPEYFYHSSW